MLPIFQLASACCWLSPLSLCSRLLRLCSSCGVSVTIVTQFGKSGDKTATYQAVFSALEQSLANGGQLRGALFWRWNEDGGSDLNTVYTNDSTWRYSPATSQNPISTYFVSWARGDA